ncbi:MAG: hypothetical protein E7157_04885 [Lactobacillales bacterium]|nr:hypothetical protein [Lactobacillales bacterium]
MKNIIIIGPSRVGKSTLASILCQKYNFNYISGDSIRNAFIDIYPELGYTVKDTIERKDFCEFINFIINQNNIHLKRDIYYVIDSADISIKNAKEVFKNSLIIGIGCKDISAEELKNKILEHDNNLDWTYGYNEEDLLSISKGTINSSINLYNECVLNNICYFDASTDRYETYNEIYKYIESNIEV